MHQPGEPSVEVILDSIKRVIARENKAIIGRNGRGGPVEFAPEYEPEFEEEADERLVVDPADDDEAAEVLQLDEDEIIAHAPAAAAADEAEQPYQSYEETGGDEDLDSHGWSEPEGLGEAEQPVQPVAETPHAFDVRRSGQAGEQPLTSEETRAAMRENLSALSMLSALARGRQAEEGGVSIDDLARDLLRPMLADWLDANMPPLVERLVQAEIERIMGGDS